MTQPNFLSVPSAYKSGKIYSVVPFDGSADMDFARASLAYRTNSNFDLEEMASGVPRLDYKLVQDGIRSCPMWIYEPQRTNLLLYSQEFDNAAWGKTNVTITPNSAIAPDGTMTADRLVLDAVSDLHILFQVATVSTSLNYSQTYYVKNDGLDFIQIYSAGGGFATANYANFDLVNGIVSNNGFISASIEGSSNGFYRITVVKLSTGNDNGVLGLSGIESFSDGFRPTFTGDGTSGVYIWNAQLEKGSYATSPIKTEGSKVTRLKDTSSTTGLGGILNDSEGTLFFEGTFIGDETNKRISISDGGSNYCELGINSNGNTQCTLAVADVIQFDFFATGGIELGQNAKIAIAYATNDFRFWVNGVLFSSSSSGTTFPNGTLNTLQLARPDGAANYFTGKVKEIALFDTALTDTELQNLTTL